MIQQYGVCALIGVSREEARSGNALPPLAVYIGQNENEWMYLINLNNYIYMHVFYL